MSSSSAGAELPPTVESGPAPSIRFEDPIPRFMAEAVAVDAEVSQVDQVTAIGVVGRVFAATDETRYLAWDEVDDVLPGLTSWLDQSGCERVDANVAADREARLADHNRVGSASVGITTADAAIAASGSVMLAHGTGRPRSASLLVDTHIVLLPSKRIVHSLSDAMALVDLDDTSNIVIVTGPSRTGDIESVRTLGVHGPRHVHILLIE